MWKYSSSTWKWFIYWGFTSKSKTVTLRDTIAEVYHMILQRALQGWLFCLYEIRVTYTGGVQLWKLQSLCSQLPSSCVGARQISAGPDRWRGSSLHAESDWCQCLGRHASTCRADPQDCSGESQRLSEHSLLGLKLQTMHFQTYAICKFLKGSNVNAVYHISVHISHTSCRIWHLDIRKSNVAQSKCLGAVFVYMISHHCSYFCSLAKCIVASKQSNTLLRANLGISLDLTSTWSCTFWHKLQHMQKCSKCLDFYWLSTFLCMWQYCINTSSMKRPLFFY